jgi:hypothetical protein
VPPIKHIIKEIVRQVGQLPGVTLIVHCDVLFTSELTPQFLTSVFFHPAIL